MSKKGDVELREPRAAGGVGEFSCAYRCLRTAANASTKVGSALGYQAAWRVGKWSECKAWAMSTTRLNNLEPGREWSERWQAYSIAAAFPSRDGRELLRR